MADLADSAAAAAGDAAPSGRAEEEAGDRRRFDLGNLMVFDPVDVRLSQAPEQATKECLELGRAAVQALVDKLFALPHTDEKFARVIELPQPETRLPRAKPMPKPKPPTKWERFAQSKGIIKRKRSKLGWDEEVGEFRRRHGYKRMHDENDTWVVEAKPTDDPSMDPFTKMKKDKKARVAKQEKQQLQNLKMAAKTGGKLALPSTLQLAARALPVTGGGPSAPRPGKGELGHAASLVGVSTASGGKFDKKLPGEKPLKKQGKHRKFLPVVEGQGMGSHEKQQTRDVLTKILSKNSHDVLDVDKAVNRFKTEQESKRAEKNRENGTGDKRKPKGGKHKGGGKMAKRNSFSKHGKRKKA